MMNIVSVSAINQSSGQRVEAVLQGWSTKSSAVFAGGVQTVEKPPGRGRGCKGGAVSVSV